jgi:hypothetical protein
MKQRRVRHQRDGTFDELERLRRPPLAKRDDAEEMQCPRSVGILRQQAIEQDLGFVEMAGSLVLAGEGELPCELFGRIRGGPGWPPPAAAPARARRVCQST